MALSKTEIDRRKNAILEAVSAGKSVNSTCKELKINRSMIFKWIQEDKEFSDQYAKARELCYDVWAEQILDIADTPCPGEKVKILASGEKETTIEDMTNHRRLQIDARKWIVAKLAPKKYGDKLELSGDQDNPLKIEQTIDVSKLSTQALAEILAVKDANKQ